MAIWHESLEHFREVLGHLFEGKLKGLVLSVLQGGHEFFNLVVTPIQFFFAFQEFSFFFGERDELI